MAHVGVVELATYQQGLSEQQKLMFLTQYASERKDRTVALALSIIFGGLGLDRFYVGDTVLGILKLLTLGLCGIMYVSDWFRIMSRADNFNRQLATDIVDTISQ